MVFTEIRGYVVALTLVPNFILDHYEVHEWRHAIAVIANDFPAEWQDILDFLNNFRLYETDFTIPGGNRSTVARVIDSALTARGWIEKGFDTRMLVDGVEMTNPTHKIDSYKNRIALEVEWNNKDPFYDRDLNNFRILFDLRTISVGVILTRCDGLQSIANRLGRGSSYGQSTTHMSRLLPRVHGGGAGGCPVLVFGISEKLYIAGARP